MEKIFPSYSLFLQWKNRYKVIPFIHRFPLQEDLFFQFFKQKCSNNPNTFFLDSARTFSKARYSYFPLRPPKTIYAPKNLNDFPTHWKMLKDVLKTHAGPPLPPSFPPFYGGAAGILSYDAGRCFEPAWKTKKPSDPLNLPPMEFGIYDTLACYDHKIKKAFAILCFQQEKKMTGSNRFLYNQCQEEILRVSRDFLKQSRTLCLPKSGSKTGPSRQDHFIYKGNKKRFIDSVSKIKKYIAQGDIYQANLTQRIELPFNKSAETYFEKLRQINPSPYACLFKYPDFQIASASPELLIRGKGDTLETRPIAGTRPRGGTKTLDKKLEGELILNEKERAEHVMLVDLERNDLGKVCRHGSVRVKEKMGIEKYSHVMHIVSHVAGVLKKSNGFFNAIEAVFPGGTITGCPKIRCMEILDEIEPCSRTFFFGSAGWIGYQGDGELNLLIRTALIKRGKIYIQAGSGIVADSDPAREFQESLDKAKALLVTLTF